MDAKMKIINSVAPFPSLFTFLDHVQPVFQNKVIVGEHNLICPEFVEELKRYSGHENICLYFGQTLRDIICVLIDKESREHRIRMYYAGYKKILITSADIPYSSILDREYSSLEEVSNIFKEYLDSLAPFFRELEYIDKFCTVLEPVNPSFKEEFRRIFLDERTWLHVEVTAEGLATNIHLIGNSEYWHDKLQSGLLKWDHDTNIIKNIMTIFDLSEFPVPTNKSTAVGAILNDTIETSVCSICLCNELPEYPGLPLPLCQNPSCGIYFHRLCLFQWLVACAGGRLPAFGVATGSCPTCLNPISCNEKES